MYKMLCKIFALVFVLNTFAIQLHNCAPTSAPATSNKASTMSLAQLNPEYMRAIAAYRRLEQRLTRKELRALTTIGILNGARTAEQQMEEHLIAVIKDLLQHTDVDNVDNIMPKIDEIEKQLLRDQRALQILTSALDLATSTKDVRAFKQEMRLTMREVVAEQKATTLTDGEDSAELAPRIAALRQQIIKQVESMKTLVDEKITKTLAYLIEEAGEHDLLAKARHKVVRKRNAAMKRRIDRTDNLDEPAEVRIIKSILSEADFRQNLIDEQFEKRSDTQNDDNNNNNNNKNKDNNNNDNIDDIFAVEFNNITATNRGRPQQQQKAKNRKNNGNNNNINNSKGTTTTTLTKSARQVIAVDVPTEVAEAAAAAQMDDDGGSPEFPDDGAGGPAGGGGLVGIISGLSGGEGGSDIGALIGALTGVISTLFGPGGLDIESLISTATSLISGLLSGNKNFGTVLGQYVGTAFDGLSGGGGAINNGQFLGNFLGTVIASLSADPEDEAGPQPLLFAQSLLSTFLEAKNRKTSGETSEERKGSAELLPKQKKAALSGGGGGSDSGSFVKQIVAHIVSNVVSLVLNASVGASGGASHASGALLSGSSSASHHTQAGGHHGGKAWT